MNKDYYQLKNDICLAYYAYYMESINPYLS